MTKNILHIDTSPRGDNSVTRKLATKLLSELEAKYPGSRVVVRDLAAHPLPHLSGPVLEAFFTPPESRDGTLSEAIKLSDQAVDELLAADIIIIGAPMWNFGIPSVLKAWIDHIARANRTFKYTATGPEPLVPSTKKLFVISSRGGVYSEGPAKIMDYQESYLKAVLGFIGLTDISFVRAEGIALGDDAAKSALVKAEAELAETLNQAA